MIEQSQHRVEGANFDIRKHLLEYDDVLNAQRMRIYAQRDRVFEKEDLSEDVDELLSQEVERRVQEATGSGELWRLMAWLEQIQPLFQTPEGLFPSFTYQVLLDELNRAGSDSRTVLLEIARRALQADHNFFVHLALDQIDRAGENLKEQIRERSDALDAFFDTLADQVEAEARSSQQLLEDLTGAVRMPLRLTGEQSRQLSDDPRALEESLRLQVASALLSVAITRLTGAIEFRLGEPLGVDPAELTGLEWDEAAPRLEERLHQVLATREERLLGEDGQIVRDLDAAVERQAMPLDDQAKLRLLALVGQGTSTYFDTKTHRQMRQVFLRLHYVYLAGEILADLPEGELEDRVLDHLQKAQAAQRLAFGASEMVRVAESMPSPSAEDLGRRIQTQIYRQVLLGAITELWVDYLTRVEALRVSVGLEAYAQRDPLVQYKSEASQMFQTLLSDIRAAVIGRIFLYQPRAATTLVETPVAPVPGPAPVAPQTQTASTDKKRKRHRH
jgi:preprotein translocase subunit SecA